MREVEPVALATESQQEAKEIVVNTGLPEMPTNFDDVSDDDWRVDPKAEVIYLAPKRMMDPVR